jgi:hypothetical protein
MSRKVQTKAPVLDDGPGIVPEVPAEWSSPVEPKGESKTIKKKIEITNTRVEAWRDFAEDNTVIVHDTRMEGLRLRIGRHRATWQFYRDDRRHGRRRITASRLGFFPDMKVEDARRAAEVVAGRLSAGQPEPGKRHALKFNVAFDSYIEHLKRNAAKKGKALDDGTSSWSRNVDRLGKQLLLPMWKNWTLAEMANNPGAVSQWHHEVTKNNGPVSANHCARVIRALYKRSAKTDLTLPSRDPCAAVEYNDESPAQKAMAFKAFPKWLKAWQAIEVGPKAPTRKEYHLFCLLSGARPGEAARIRWRNVKPSARVIEIPGAKAGNTIHIIMSAAIARVLKRARDTAKPSGLDDFVFPHSAQFGHRENLPTRGHAFRHTWRTIAADCKVDDLLAHVMLGHAPKNISESYITRFVLASGPSLRQAQRKVSRRILLLLGSDPTL